jgi:hypothetical protein
MKIPQMASFPEPWQLPFGVFGHLETEQQEILTNKKQNKLRSLSPRANYTNQASAACRRS